MWQKWEITQWYLERNREAVYKATAFGAERVFSACVDNAAGSPSGADQTELDSLASKPLYLALVSEGTAPTPVLSSPSIAEGLFMY